MSEQRQPGDPLKSDQDRYLMLETLLCARQVLYISYCARSLKDNSVCQPSVLVQELLDFVDTRFQLPQGSKTRVSKTLTNLHPMQTFAAGNFSPPAFSYDDYWCSIASQMLKPIESKPASAWPAQALAPDPEQATDLGLIQLRRFLQHPIRYFFNQRLNLWLDEVELIDDEEPFTLEGLEKWHIKQRLVEDFLACGEIQPEHLLAEGQLPHGHAAIESFGQVHDELENLRSRLEPFRGLVREPRDFVTHFDEGIHLSGRIEHYYAGRGLMHFTTASIKGKDLISLWLDHLALCASDQFEEGDTSSLIWQGGISHFNRLDTNDAVLQLNNYLALHRSGMSYPLPVFPGASYAWSIDENINKALAKWHGNRFNNIPGDRHDAYIRLALRGSDQAPVPGPEFEACAEAIYATMHEYITES